MSKIEEIILNALQERKIFIGIMMLCRYLNGRGYKRFGCNAGYEKPYTHGNDRINPCPVLCEDKKYRPSKIRYHILKLADEGKLFTIKAFYYDSKNPNSKTKPKKTDLFRFVCLTEEIFKDFMSKNTLEVFL